jgi:hypothetical protein
MSFLVIVIDKGKQFCRRAYYMVVTESFGLAFAASVLAYMLLCNDVLYL